MLSKELEPIAKALIKQAKKGEIGAIRELFDRAWGKAPQLAKIENEGKPYVANIIVFGEDDRILTVKKNLLKL